MIGLSTDFARVLLVQYYRRPANLWLKQGSSLCVMVEVYLRLPVAWSWIFRPAASTLHIVYSMPIPAPAGSMFENPLSPSCQRAECSAAVSEGCILLPQRCLTHNMVTLQPWDRRLPRKKYTMSQNGHDFQPWAEFDHPLTVKSSLLHLFTRVAGWLRVCSNTSHLVLRSTFVSTTQPTSAHFLTAQRQPLPCRPWNPFGEA